MRTPISTTRAAHDWSISAVAAGFFAVLVSYSGPLAIVFQAAESAGVSHEMLASWVWGISIGAGVSGILLSWWLRAPIVTAWSAPGTALLVTLFPGLSLNEAIGAYLTAGAVLLVIGLSGYFDRIIRLIPQGIAAGMMAGILFQFGVGAFRAAGEMPVLAFGMIAAYILFRRFTPRYAIVLVLLTGVMLSWAAGNIDLQHVRLGVTLPEIIRPEWSWAATLSLALPLVLVSLTGQFLPGMTILRLDGFNIPARPIITTTSLVSLLVAFVGGITIVIAAITAALCTGRDAHENPGQRYVAGLSNGFFYLVGGLCAGTIVVLFTSLPTQFVAILAGLALIGAILSNVVTAMADTEGREAAIITFLATASGMNFLGLASAFWGVVIGSVAYVVLHKPWRRR